MNNDAQDSTFLGACRVGATAQDLGGHVQWYHSVATPGASTVTASTVGGGSCQGEQAPPTGVQGHTPQGALQQQQTPRNRQAVVEALKKEVAAADGAKKKWKFTWQRQSGVNGRVEFKEEVLSTEGIRCFAVAREGTLVITIVHGLRKYYFAGASTAVKGKVFGRMGEWSQEAQPHIVEMQPGATWEWEKFDLATNEIQWAQFCTSENSGGKLWKPAQMEAARIEEKVRQLPG
jgi:hypothetical protein